MRRVMRMVVEIVRDEKGDDDEDSEEEDKVDRRKE